MKPLYCALIIALTFVGLDGWATPITPVPPPNAPGEAPELPLKLLTSSPDPPMAINSRLEGLPKELRG